MKKILSLFAALLFVVAANAKVTEISPTSPYETDAVRLALYYSAEGDTIVLTKGTYEESNSDYIAFKRNNVLMAKEGDTVIIKPHVSFRVRNGARAEMIGIRIDASEINKLSNYENIFEVHDATEGNCWVLKDCEIYDNVAKTVMRHASDKTLDSIIIDGCYIHDNVQATLRLQSATLKGVIIKNTTIANVANGGSFWCAPIDICKTAADAKVVVDHCTFYHNTTISTSYADVTVGYDGSATSDVTISNCIFAQPESYSAGRAINLVNGGVVKNCLTFNYAKSTDGIQGETTRTACITGDPLFVKPGEANYTLGEGSPALTAAEDGGAIGDPRWWPAPAAKTTLYCKMTQSWWTADGAAVGIYAWDGNGSPKVTWPGERMTPVEGEEGVWSFELDTDTYKNCIFTRVNGNGAVSDWGAKTKDLTIPTDGKNLFTITNTTAVWGDPGCDGEWSVYGATPLAEAPDAAPAAPEWPANQVKAVYSATYGADCGFGEWGSSTAYTQESFGKKYVTTNLGYFGMTFEDNALNCSAMEKLHLDIWIAASASVRVVPIWGASANIGVTLNLEGQKWNSFDIALSEFDGVPDWSNIYQIKIDEARELTFWVNNVFFYTTVAPAVDETAPADVTASATASYFSTTITAKATDASGTVIFTVKNGDEILALKSAASDADAVIPVKGLKPNTEYNLSVIAADESGNAAEPVAVATKTLVAPAAAPAPEFKADDVKSIFSDAYTAAPASIGTMIAGWWEPTELSEGELADGDHALFYAPKATGMFGWEFAETDMTGYPFLHINIYPLADGSIMIYPVDNTDPKQEYKETVSVKGGEWNNVVIDLTGKDLTKINQIGWINYYALNGFFVDNVYFSKDAEPVVPQLNIYASGLTAGEVADGKVTVSYVLNAKATAVEIQLITTEDEVVKTFESAGKAKGLNSCELDLNGIEAATYKWAVKATSWPTKEMINVLDYDKKLYNFYLPQGLAIDNSTDSPFFGRIYVSESIDGLSDGATDRTKSTKQGIFIYDPLLTDVTSQGVVGYKGSLKCACGSTDRNSFKRVVVDKDGFVYVNSMDANVGGVYRMDPANPTADFVAVLDTTKRGTLYSPISSILVEGQGEDKVLYTAENFAASLSTGSIKKYAIGNTTNFANEAETVILNSSSYGLGISDNQFVSDGRGGFWGCQNRWGYDGFAAVYHINAAKERDYAIMKDMNTNVLPETSDVTTYRGVIAINESKTQIAIPTRGRVIVFNVAYDASTGVPTLTEAYRVSDAYGTKSNIDGIAFDRADNLYVVSASKEKLYVYATVKANNNCTTPAPSSKPIILKATGSAIEDSFAPVKAQKIFRGGEVLIIRDGKIYNMMGQIVR